MMWWHKNMVSVLSSTAKSLPMKVLVVQNPDGKLEIITMFVFENQVSKFAPKLLPHTPLWQLDNAHWSNVASG